MSEDEIPSLMESFSTLKDSLSEKRDRRGRGRPKGSKNAKIKFRMNYERKDTIITVSGYDFEKVKTVMTEIKEAL